MRAHLLVTGVFLLIMFAPACAAGNPGPVAVVRSLEEAFNSKDINATMALFSDDAVVSFLGVGSFSGKRQIAEWLEGAMHSFERVEFDEIADEGSRVTWVWSFYDSSDQSLYVSFEIAAQVEQSRFRAIHSGLPQSPKRSSTPSQAD